MVSRVRSAQACVFGISVALSFVSGSQAQARPLDPIDVIEREARVAEMEHGVWGGKALEKENGAVSSCSRWQVTLDIVDPKSTVPKNITLSVVRPRNQQPSPVIVMVPTIEGPIILEDQYASKFCRMGIATIVADVNDTAQPTELPSWGLEDRNNRLAILSLKTVLDYAEQSPHFDRTKIGLLGFSLGGITSAMMAGIEHERLQAIYVVVGGGNLPYILSVSTNDKVGELRRRRMEHSKLTKPEEYEDELRKSVRFDPMFFASRAPTEKIFMVIADKDDKVPTLVQRDLFESFGKPENTVFSGGHVKTIVSLTLFYFSYVEDFFRKRFNMTRGLHAETMRELAQPKPDWATPPTSLPR